jgi:hypothetical protein
MKSYKTISEWYLLLQTYLEDPTCERFHFDRLIQEFWPHIILRFEGDIHSRSDIVRLMNKYHHKIENVNGPDDHLISVIWDYSSDTRNIIIGFTNTDKLLNFRLTMELEEDHSFVGGGY